MERVLEAARRNSEDPGIIRIQGSMAVTQPYRAPTVYESTATGMPSLRPYLADLWGRRRFIWHLARTDLKGEHYDSAIGQSGSSSIRFHGRGRLSLRTVVRPAGSGGSSATIVYLVWPTSSSPS